MKKHKKTTCYARKAQVAGRSRFLPIGVIAVIAGFLCFAPAALRGEETVIFDKLKDADPTERSAEALRLGIEKEKAAVPALIEALKDDVTGVRINAAVALGKIADPAALEALTAMAENDAVPAARAKAVEALSRIGGAVADKQVLKAASDSDENVRAEAVRSMARRGGDAEAGVLIDKLQNDGSWSVRREAALTMAELAKAGQLSEGKVKSARKTLKRSSSKDASPEVRKAADEALRKFPAAKKKWWFF